MINFVFYNTTKIIFGTDTQKEVGKYVSEYSKKILLHYGGGSIKESGLYTQVVTSLKESGIDFLELGGVVPNPRLSLVHEGVKICKENNIDFVLAVGGGSVIDSAKAIALGAKYDGDVWDFFLRTSVPADALPVATILTIPAAGSESSNSAVITNEKDTYKIGLTDNHIRPVFSILNPVLTYTLPPFQTACGIVDMMAHLMERYFTDVKNVDFSDRLIEGALKSIIYNSPKVLNNSTDYNARAELMWAGAFAHNDLAGMGRIGCWAAHGIEHELSAQYDIAHGLGLSIIFPAWMKYVYTHNIDIFAQFASRVFDVEQCDKEQMALKGIKQLEDFFSSLGIATKLSQIGITDKDFLLMAQRGLSYNGRLLNFRPLDVDDIVNIFNLAL